MGGLGPCFWVLYLPLGEMMFCEFHGDLGWLGRHPTRSECHQKTGGKYGVEACHIVRPELGKKDRGRQNYLSEIAV